MSSITSDLLCPSCQGPLHPRVLECRTCDIRVEGDFEGSEFDRLSRDELHLLRIFIRCEGRIRDMEAALGVSYPTVKARLASLRERLGLGEAHETADAPDADAASEDAAPPESDSPDTRSPPLDVDTLLDEVEKGEVDGDEALRRLRE